MSAIGDYIHYTAQGYLDNGTNQRSNSYTFYMSQKKIYMDKAKALAKTSLNKTEREDLASVLSSFFNKNTRTSKMSEVLNDVKKRMEELFEETLQDIDFSTGDVKMKSDRSSVIGKIRSDSRITSAIKKVDKLEQILIQETQIQPIDPKVINTLKEIRKGYMDIYNQMENIEQQSKISIRKNAKIIDSNKNKLGELRNQMNELISTYAAYPAVNLQKGTFFEEIIKYAPIVAESQALGAIGEVIGDKEHAEIVSFDRKTFTDKYITKTFENTLEKTSVSQGKIDVEITWNEKNIGISAKNANLEGHYVHILTGSSLLYMLQDVDTNFVNHFLNIYAAHKTAKFRDIAQNSAVAQIRKMKSTMREEIKLILLYKALTGDNYGRKAANLFVVNDNTKGKVKVYAIDELIEKATETNNGFSILVGNNSLTASGSELAMFKNDWNEGSPEARISALLADVHSRKVSASINTATLR